MNEVLEFKYYIKIMISFIIIIRLLSSTS